MSAQPTHRESDLTSLLGKRCRLLFAVACLALAGCATQNSSQQAAGLETDDPSFLVSDRAVRSQYLNHVSSDPLGAYLAASEKVNRPQANGLASTALTFLGIKYRFGGNSPSQGFDCSGLVRYAAEKSLGLKLPRSSSEMARLGESIKKGELERGDLVFFNTRGKRFSHVGIYLGNGKFVHAPRSGSKVRVEDMNIAYWKKRYNGARRIGADLAVNETPAADTKKLASK